MVHTDRTYTDVDQALQAVYHERFRFIALAARYIGNREEAEDVFQYCAMDLMRAMRGGKQVDNLQAYFAQAVKNRCWRILRHRDYEKEMQTLMETELEYLSHNDNDVDDQRIDCGILLEKCRERLSQLAFSIYEEKKFNGLDYKTIAKKFNISERRVNTELQKAQKVFREEFKGYRLKYLLMLFLFIG